MASTADQPTPVREDVEGHCYHVGRRGRGEPRRIRDICPHHRQYLDIVCTLTGNMPEELFSLSSVSVEDRMDLMAVADAIKNLEEQCREMRDDGSGHPDLLTTRRAICVLINNSRQLAMRIKQREQAMLAAAARDGQWEAGLSDKENFSPTSATLRGTPQQATNARAKGSGRKRAALDDITIADSEATAVEKAKRANPEVIITTPNESAYTANEKEELVLTSTDIIVGNEAAGPAKAPKMTATFADRIKAKVTAAVAKVKRVRDMMC